MNVMFLGNFTLWQNYSITYPYQLPQWLSGKKSACNIGDAADTDSIPGSGKSGGEENGNPLQYSF